MKKVMLKWMATFLLAIITVKMQAQFGGNNGSTPGSGGGNGGFPTTGGGSAPVVPFDGGMSLILLASGIGYGAKKQQKK
jgi:hypothetical protein